jgi:hypothetical protein
MKKRLVWVTSLVTALLIFAIPLNAKMLTSSVAQLFKINRPVIALRTLLFRTYRLIAIFQEGDTQIIPGQPFVGSKLQDPITMIVK